MEEWKEYKLGDVCNMIPGFAFKSKDFGIGKNIAIKIKDIRPPYVEIKEADNVDTSNYNIEKLSKFLVHKGEFLLAMTGATIGKIGRYICENPAYVNQRVLKFEDAGLILYDYLYYYLSTDVFQSFITNHIDSQSAQPNISSTTIGKYPIKIPSIKVQKQIASILKSLDDKIEVNRKINENLEQQAQALFKSWFVDFEPFKNGEFVESELGMIPKGWRVGRLFDVAEIYDKIRKPLSSRDRENMDRIYPYYGATSCMDYVDNYLFDGIYTLIGEDGSVVKEDGLPYMQYVWGKFWVNNHAHILQGKNGFSTEMIHVMLSITNIQHLVTGAVQAKLSQANMQKILVALPPIDVINKIRPLIDKLYQKRRNLEDENSRLAELRDTLLPKLMSGELKVNEIEK